MFTTKKIAFLGLMLVLIIILAIVESALPPFFPLLPPQFSRIGLSNAIVMYIVFFVGKKETFMMAVLKSLFIFSIRGPMAGMLSFSGALLSITIIILLWTLFGSKISYIALSMAGAVGHNIGQLLVASLIMQNINLFIFYLPVLLISGIIFGAITGVFLKMIMPIFSKLGGGLL
jgi:heptaprenyl diphosphate synthase